LAFKDAWTTANPTIVEHIALAITLTWQNAITSAHAALVEIITCAIVHCGVGFVVASVLVCATNAETCRAAGTIVHVSTRVVVAREWVGATLTAFIVFCRVRVEVH
jgi:hypothetical protein